MTARVLEVGFKETKVEEEVLVDGFGVTVETKCIKRLLPIFEMKIVT